MNQQLAQSIINKIKCEYKEQLSLHSICNSILNVNDLFKRKGVKTKMDLPILYSIDSKGKSRMWQIQVIGNTVKTTYGLEDGKKIVSERSFMGKNVGSSNETTAAQQAELEAYRDWVQKLSKNYKPKDTSNELYQSVLKEKSDTGGRLINAVAKMDSDITKEKNVSQRSNFIVGGVLEIIPMKAQVYEFSKKAGVYSGEQKVMKYFDFQKGVYVQPKIDGYRCIVRIVNNEIVMTSNSGKQYPWFSSLRAAIKQLINGRNILDGLDCELYSHTFVEQINGKPVQADANRRFSLIQGICSLTTTQPHPLEDQIKLFVFDLVDLSGKKSQVERFQVLNQLPFGDERIIKVETRRVSNEREIFELHNRYVDDGFEGAMIRASDLVYKPKHRSQKLRKLKMFTDSEYTVIGYELDPGVATEQFVWICRTKTGDTFKVKPLGSKEYKLDLYTNARKYIGKQLTVKYQELSENGIPRFPVGKAFRYD